MIERDWYGCHASGWTDKILLPDAFAHPAKVAFGLADRIYNHCLEMGYLGPGNVVLDPFFGVGGFAYHALLNGLNVVGVELEEKFANLARANLDRWSRDYGAGVAVLDSLRERGTLPPYGQAIVLQGDSRYLAQVLREAGGVVSSPPFSQPGEQPCASQSQAIKDYHAFTRGDGTKYDRQMQNAANLANLPEGNHAAVVSSPPYAESVHDGNGIDPDKLTGNPAGQHSQAFAGGYGTASGQLGAMRVVSSPPYAESLASDDPDKRGGLYRDEKRRNDKTLTAEYGESEGQLGAMRVVSSPPYENNAGKGGETKGFHSYDGNEAYNRCKRDYIGLGDVDNLGNTTASDFWSAARLIMQQVAMLLPPGACAVWVCKRFVKDKKIVEFSQQWAALGESCGFETIEWIRAWLIEDRGAQYDLFGGLEEKQVKRASFFRRLYERKYPENAIDWEDVIIQKRVAT